MMKQKWIDDFSIFLLVVGMTLIWGYYSASVRTENKPSVIDNENVTVIYTDKGDGKYTVRVEDKKEGSSLIADLTRDPNYYKNWTLTNFDDYRGDGE